MTKLTRYLTIWREIAVICVKEEINYRANFFLTLLDSLIWLGLSFWFFYILIYNFGNVAGYSMADIMVLIGIAELVKIIIFSLFIGGITSIPRLINSGELDLYLTKPLNPAIYLSIRKFSLPDLIAVIPALILIIIGLFKSDHFPVVMLLPAVIAVCMSVGIVFNAWLSLITISFWTKAANSDVSGVVISLLGLAKYPKEIYKGMLKLFFSFIIPVALIANIPLSLLLNDLNLVNMLSFIAIFMIFHYLRKYLWRLGLKSYCSPGG